MPSATTTSQDEPDQSEPTPTDSAGATSTAPASPSTPPTASVAPSEVSTEDRSEAPPDEVVRVVGVEVRMDGDTEQIVIATTGGTPGWSLRYVDAVRIDGEPIIVQGRAALELVLESADPNGDQGLSDDVAVELLPDQPLLRELRYAYYLGDQVTYAVGLSERAPFSVSVGADEIVITFSP